MYEYYQYDKDGVFYAGVKHRNNTGGGDKERFKVTLFGQTIVSYGKVCEFGDAEIVLIVKAPAGMPRIEAKTTSGDNCLLRHSVLKFTQSIWKRQPPAGICRWSLWSLAI